MNDGRKKAVGEGDVNKTGGKEEGTEAILMPRTGVPDGTPQRGWGEGFWGKRAGRSGLAKVSPPPMWGLEHTDNRAYKIELWD